MMISLSPQRTQPQTWPCDTLHRSHCRSSHPHITVPQAIDPEIAVSPTHNHPTNLQGMSHVDVIHAPAGQEEDYSQNKNMKDEDRRSYKLITTAQMYYSSDSG